MELNSEERTSQTFKQLSLMNITDLFIAHKATLDDVHSENCLNDMSCPLR